MKHILNNLSEGEKNAIRKQHTGGMKVITENFSKLLNSKLGDVKLISEQTATKGFPEIPQKVPKELAQKTFFNQLAGVIKPTIGSKIQFIDCGRTTQQDMKENKKQTLVFKKFLPTESFIREYFGYMSIEMVFQTDLYRPNSNTPIPCYTIVETNVRKSSKSGDLKFERPEVYLNLNGFDNLSERFNGEKLFIGCTQSNDNLRMTNLKIDSDAVMNLFKQYDATSLRKTPQ